MLQTNRVYRFRTRWPVEQIGERAFNVIIPAGDPAALSITFAPSLNLSDAEHDAAFSAAEDAVIRTILITR